MPAIRRRLSYANVVATLALVIALGGGVAYAANTVFSSDIVNGEVKAADIATGAVQTDEIAGSAVRTGEIANNQVRAADIGPDQINGSKVADQSLSGVDILDSSVSSADLATNSVQSEEILDGAVNSDEIADGSVGSFDIKSESVTGSDIADHSLRGIDLGEAEFIRFDATFGNVSPQSCSPGQVTGLPSDARDHLVLTEASATTNPFLVMSPVYSVASGTAVIRACNLSTVVVAGGTHTFNLLVIDAD